MEKKTIRMTESEFYGLIRNCINEVVGSISSDEENIATYDVFNKNMSLTQIKSILDANLYGKDDNFVGRLSDLHFKYDPESNHILGSEISM